MYTCSCYIFALLNLCFYINITLDCFTTWLFKDNCYAIGSVWIQKIVFFLPDLSHKNFVQMETLMIQPCTCFQCGHHMLQILFIYLFSPTLMQYAACQNAKMITISNQCQKWGLLALVYNRQWSFNWVTAG